jgi:hypothetical protein
MSEVLYEYIPLYDFLCIPKLVCLKFKVAGGTTIDLRYFLFCLLHLLHSSAFLLPYQTKLVYSYLMITNGGLYSKVEEKHLLLKGDISRNIT